MIKFILVAILSVSYINNSYADEDSLECKSISSEIKRCENKEVVCYIYDTGWAGFTKSGRGAGISCIKKEDSK